MNDFSDLYQLIIVSLLSGGVVAFLGFTANLFAKYRTQKKLSKLLNNEIKILFESAKSIVESLEESKDGWYRKQLGFGSKPKIFNFTGVQELLLKLNTDRAINILDFYAFYDSLDRKLKSYSKFLTEKVDKDNNNEDVDSLIKLLTEASEIIYADYYDMKKIYDKYIKTCDPWMIKVKRYLCCKLHRK